MTSLSKTIRRSSLSRDRYATGTAASHDTSKPLELNAPQCRCRAVAHLLIGLSRRGATAFILLNDFGFIHKLSFERFLENRIRGAAGAIGTPGVATEELASKT